MDCANIVAVRNISGSTNHQVVEEVRNAWLLRSCWVRAFFLAQLVKSQNLISRSAGEHIRPNEASFSHDMHG